MSITIGDTLLRYETAGKDYIITYIEDYDTELYTFIDILFERIYSHYQANNIFYSNQCGCNAKFICKDLEDVKMEGLTRLTLGKIIIIDWASENKRLQQTIESVYGPIRHTIGATYHALPYLEVIIKHKTYYIAIETTTCDLYYLQFCIGSNKKDFKKIIKTRYQCTGFKISRKCEKEWEDIAYPPQNASSSSSSEGGNPPKYKSTGVRVYILYKNNRYNRIIYMNMKDKRKTKYCKINGEYILLSKLKIVYR